MANLPSKKAVREERVRVCPDSRDASKDYTLPKSEAKALFEAGKLAIDATNSTPTATVYTPPAASSRRAPARKVLDDATEHIKKYLPECCREVLEFQQTSILCSGHVRAAAKVYAKAVPHDQALKMAIDTTAKLAMAQVAESTAPASQWKRTCQECSREQLCKEPPTPLTDAYRNAKCRYCKSEALDYGSGGWSIVRGKPVRIDQ